MRLWGGPRTAVRLLTALVTAASAVLVAPATAGAGGDRNGTGGWTRDSVTVAGYDDYRIDRTVDVINRTGGNNLVFWFTAGRAIVDGTLTIDLPAQGWPTPLRASDFDGAAPLDPATTGKVGVRPQPSPESGADDRYCGLGSSYDLPDGTGHAFPFRLTVTNTERVRRIEAAHLTCAAGQRIAIRIVGLTAPRTGLERFPVQFSDISGPRRVADPWLLVKPTPAVRLVFDDLPSTVSVATDTTRNGDDFGVPVRLRAVGPNGRPIKNYSGTIRMYTSPVDCTVLNRGFKDFAPTRISGPTKFLFPFTLGGTRALVAEDIDHRAVTATSNVVTVVDGTPTPHCPASYH